MTPSDPIAAGRVWDHATEGLVEIASVETRDGVRYVRYWLQEWSFVFPERTIELPEEQFRKLGTPR